MVGSADSANHVWPSRCAGCRWTRRCNWSSQARLSVLRPWWRSASWSRDELRSAEHWSESCVEGCYASRRSLGAADSLSEVAKVPDDTLRTHAKCGGGRLPTHDTGLVEVAGLNVAVGKKRQVKHSSAVVTVGHVQGPLGELDGVLTAAASRSSPSST